MKKIILFVVVFIAFTSLIKAQTSPNQPQQNTAAPAPAAKGNNPSAATPTNTPAPATNPPTNGTVQQSGAISGGTKTDLEKQKPIKKNNN